MEAYYDRDVDRGALDGKTIAVIGYGSQGRAHALNLHDSRHAVVVGLRPGFAKRDEARRDGLAVASISDAVAKADVVAMLIPDEEQPGVYLREVVEHLRPGTALMFAHGFGIHFGTIVPPGDVDVIMIAPKGPGRLVRTEFEAGRGVPCLVAVHQDATGHARAIAFAYAAAIGGGRAGILETTFREETETDLFGEQAVLCGGMSALVKAGFETLVEAGYAPEMAYFECLHEMKLIVDLMYERGIEGMRNAISNTAKYGDYTRGSRVITDETRARDATRPSARFRAVRSPRNGSPSTPSGKPSFRAFRAEAAEHEIEHVGTELRGLMPWLNGGATAAEADDGLRFRVL